MSQVRLVMLLLYTLLFAVVANSNNALAIECLPSDHEALMDFKNGLQDSHNRLSSWRNNNCCHWHGIYCDNVTGAVVAIDLHNPHQLRSLQSNLSGEISPSLMKLKSLRSLDLSFNTFKDILIPKFFGSLVNLQYLNLSNAGFAGLIPPHLGNLSHLQSLDLTSYDLHVVNLQWVSGLVSLKHLAMDGVDLSLITGTNLVSALNQLPFLMEVHLSSCHLFGHISSPSSLNFTSLSVLDLSFNKFVSTVPDWLVNISTIEHIDISINDLYGKIPIGLKYLPKLQYLNLRYNKNLTASCSQLFMGGWERIQMLDLSHNEFNGRIPSSIGNLTYLTYLDLSYNAIEGFIPSSIGEFCHLNIPDLSENNMTGALPEFLQGIDNCPSRKPLPNLAYFIMRYNQLHGKIPYWLVQLESLDTLDLSHNLLEGPIPASLGSLQNLMTLELEGNKLNGTLPISLGQLSRLAYLDVSSNQLTGVVTKDHFSKLSKLESLIMSSNSFILNVSTNWIPPFQVYLLDMGSCALGPSFPPWLKSQSKVGVLDFSNASLFDFIPHWFWDISSGLSVLNMSHNELRGWFPNSIHVQLESVVAVDLSFNLLDGPIPVFKPGFLLLDLSHNLFSGVIPYNISHNMENVFFLSLSHNQLHGEIPLSFGEMFRVTVIDLSENNLTGRIPANLANCLFLDVLDLGNNNMFGTIPGFLFQLMFLRSIHLNDNFFSGNLPRSLKKLSRLETINIGNNILSGIIPLQFSECFPFLRILILRSNAFSGELSLEFSKLGSLQVLDLARNDLSGSIPASLGDLKAIARVHRKNKYLLYGQDGDHNGHSYEENLEVYMKDQMLKYTKTLSLVTCIDLSDNNFSGNIPNEITKLFGLVVLNLSRNHITGKIPETMSNLLQLSSLDLSNNQISGTIPSSLSSLSFLGFLDLSNNNLMGVIPYTGHMTTFDAIAFAGNPGLCGPPLPVKCSGDDDKKRGNDDSNDEGLFDNWFYLCLGLGFASGILVPYVILTMKTSWGDVYFDFVDHVIHKLLRQTPKQGINHGQRWKIPRRR